MSKKILFLPDAGPDNPFQYQLIDFLRSKGFWVQTGKSRRFFASILSVKKYKPDVVYYDWIQSFVLGRTLLITLLKSLLFAIEIIYIKFIRKIPIVHTVHNLQNHARLWIWWENIIYKWFLKQIVLIRVYSETTKHKIIRLYGISPEKILVIKDIPYNHFYPNEVGGLKSRHFLNLPPDAFVYLFFGSVKPYKGIETLITTFNHLPSENDYLIIAGICREKKYFQHILELSGKNTRIVIHNEFIKMDHVQYYMNAADVVVLPFINVEHSGSVDLAVSFAKPVVTIGTSLLREQLRNQSELLFDDPDQLLRILKEVKSMDLKKIGEDNFRAVELSNFSEIVALFH